MHWAFDPAAEAIHRGVAGVRAAASAALVAGCHFTLLLGDQSHDADREPVAVRAEQIGAAHPHPLEPMDP